MSSQRPGKRLRVKGVQWLTASNGAEWSMVRLDENYKSVGSGW